MLRLLLVPLLLAVSVSDVPNPRTTHGGWVSDTADQLSEAEERLLEDKLSQLHAELGYEVAVVTVKTTPDTPKMFATELFNNWGIGNSARNDGLLVLLAMESRRLEMETGYGLESKLPDAWVVRMQREHMVPHFKTGNFGAGLLAGLEQVDRRLRGAPSGEASSTTGTTRTESSNRPAVDLGSTTATTIYSDRFPEDFPEKPHWIDYLKIGEFKRAMWKMGPLDLLGFGLFMIVVFFLWARWRRLRAFKLCSSCGNTRLLLPEEEEDDHLSAGQEKEEELGSVDYDVWACPGCSSIAIDAKSAWFSSYSACPKCSRKTLKKTSKTIQAATTERSGSARVTEDCKNCKHSRTYTRTIPRVVESSSSSGSSYSWSSSSSSSSYSSSSSSSSFGGGSSGGGGGGSSW